MEPRETGKHFLPAAGGGVYDWFVENTRAILLRKTRLTETSLVITWFTAAHGKLKTVAKGARQPKSRFAGRLDLFYDCEIQFVRSRRSELHTLREVVLVDPHAGLRMDYGRVALGAYFVELLELVTEPEHAAPELFELCQRALAYVNANSPNLRALLHFEAELVRLLGIQNPSLTADLALARAYHRLPSPRAALVKRLGRHARG